MSEDNRQEPQAAADYDDRTTAAVKSVLIEIGQILGDFRGKFAVIGGAVPWLLLENEEMPHAGTIDVDLDLDAEALGDGEYVQLVDALKGNGYQQREDMKRFQLIREVPATDGGNPIEVTVDFLMPRDAEIIKNKPPLIAGFAAQRADGAELALQFYKMVAIDGPMPEGGKNRVEIAVSSIPALLAMKGHAMDGRHKQKDAYDIYYCVRNYPGGAGALAEACQPLLAHESAVNGYGHINGKFRAADDYGPWCVRQFVLETRIMGDRTPEQWQCAPVALQIVLLHGAIVQFLRCGRRVHLCFASAQSIAGCNKCLFCNSFRRGTVMCCQKVCGWSAAASPENSTHFLAGFSVPAALPVRATGRARSVHQSNRIWYRHFVQR